MPRLREITGIINTALRTGVFASQPFQSSRFDEIADQVLEITETGESKRPVITANDGQLTDLGVDDNYSLQVYHRVDDLTYEDNQDADFGDLGNTTTETADMRIIVVGDKGRLNVVEEDVAAAVWTSIPRKLDHATAQSLGLQSALIEPGVANTNTRQVFSEEYSSEFRIKPNTFIISIKYKIITEYNKNCFSICSN